MPRRSSRSAFTLVEAVLSIALTSIAGGAILVGISSSINVTSDVVRQTIAEGLARQLLDETLGKMYAEIGSGAYQTTLCANATELAGTGRSLYNDIDDYHGITNQPPKDPWARTMGTENGTGGTRNINFQIPANYFADWRQVVEVYYVSGTNLSQRLTGTQTSDYRAIDVQISYKDPVKGWLLLAQARQVVTFLQTP